MDLGENWRVMEKFIIQFAWAKQQKDSKVPDKRVIIAHEVFGRGH